MVLPHSLARPLGRGLVLVVLILSASLLFVTTPFDSGRPNTLQLAGSRVSLIHSDLMPIGGNSVSTTTGYVKWTLCLFNNQLLPGVATCPSNPNFQKALVPVDILSDPSNGNVYVADQDADNISVISGSSNHIVATIPVGNVPTSEAYNAQGRYLYVANWGSENISVIADTTNQVVRSIAVPTGPGILVSEPQQGILYVGGGSQTSGYLSVVSEASSTVLANISLDEGPLSGAFDSQNQLLYLVMYERGIEVVNISTDSVTGFISDPEAGGDAFFDSQNGFLYVGSNAPDVTLISTKTNTLVGNLTVGSSPSGTFTYDPSVGHVFVSIDHNRIAVINADTNGYVGTLILGPVGPVAATFDNASGYIYVADAGDDAVTIVSPMVSPNDQNPATFWEPLIVVLLVATALGIGLLIWKFRATTHPSPKSARARESSSGGHESSYGGESILSFGIGMS